MLSIFKEKEFACRYSADSVAACGDCLGILKSIKDQQVDLIFADPPYNLGKDFGNRSDQWKDMNSYLQWCYGWIDECFRILKDTGSMYLMNSTQNMPYISVYINDKYNIINSIIWYYDSSGVQSKKRFGSLYEPLLLVNKDSRHSYTFNWEDILVEAKTGAKRGLIDYRKAPPQPYNKEKVPGNVWQFPRVRYRMPEYENHPTQKPEALLKRIILTSSNPGDIVLDPFAGSFTTCAVALAHQRRAVGIDLNEEYFKIGLRRTNICTTFKGEALHRNLERKTNHKSKINHHGNGTLVNKQSDS